VIGNIYDYVCAHAAAFWLIPAGVLYVVMMGFLAWDHGRNPNLDSDTVQGVLLGGLIACGLWWIIVAVVLGLTPFVVFYVSIKKLSRGLKDRDQVPANQHPTARKIE
jgi:hypothetical protein